MGRFLILLMVIAIGFPGGAHAFDACKRAKNSMDELACIDQKYEGVQADLSALYDSLLQTQNEDALPILREAQQTWVAYRDLECAWEAAQDAGEMLNRLREVACLVKVTQGRIAVLQSFIPGEDTDKIAEPTGILVESPRWLNTLSDEDPDIFWRYGSRVETDLNCDGTAEFVLPGVQLSKEAGHKPARFVAIVENPAMGLPGHQNFAVGDVEDEAQDIADHDSGGCTGDLQLTLKPGDITDPVDGQAEDTSDSTDHANADDVVCGAELKVQSGTCAPFILSWDGQDYIFAPASVPAPEQEQKQDD